MITEKDLSIAYTEIESNTTIRAEVLDFIFKAAIKELEANGTRATKDQV